MSKTIKLLRIIGSPFSPAGSELPSNANEAWELYRFAVQCKVGLLYLETLKQLGKLGNLEPQYEKDGYRYRETLVTAGRISKALDLIGVEHAVFKLIKSYPSTPTDVDVILLSSKSEYRRAFEILFSKDYWNIGECASQLTVYDLRGGYENMDTRTRGGAQGGIYYLDLYKEVSADHIIYMDKAKLGKYVVKVNLNGEEFKTLKLEADLATILTHSIFPEQLYMLSDYYTTIYYLKEAGKEGVDSFINIVRENHVNHAAKLSLALTAALHQEVHGFVPECVEQVLARFGTGAFEVRKLTQSDFKVPHRYSLRTVGRVLMEKAKESKARRSIIRQIISTLNPRKAWYTIIELVFRRSRETY